MTDLVVIVVAMAFGAFLKGLTGSGLPVLAIPVMATFFGVERAVVIMAIPGIVSNSWLMWVHRGHLAETRDLPVLLVTGTVGAVLGTFLLREIDPLYLSLALAGVIVAYIVRFFTRPEAKLAPGVTRVLSWPVGFSAGVLQGATGISGPLVTTYVHSYRMKREAFVLAIATMFQVFSLVQAVSLAALGLFTPDRVREGLLAIVPLAVMPLGTLLGRRLDRRLFDYAVLVLLAGTACKMVFDAVTG
jgi:uncharacterized protein